MFKIEVKPKKDEKWISFDDMKAGDIVVHEAGNTYICFGESGVSDNPKIIACINNPKIVWVEDFSTERNKRLLEPGEYITLIVKE